MKIVVDTNVICQDYRFEGTGFRFFFDKLKHVYGQLVFPEVVIDEVVNRYQEELGISIDDVNRAERKLSRLVEDRRFKVRLIQNQIELTKEYREFLFEKIKNLGGTILSYPNVEHKTIVERDLKRIKPFKLDGSGYRDFLIWENIKSILLSDNGDIVFISNNKRDFGEGPSIDNAYHAEMPDPQKLTICRSVKDFNEKYILPKIKMLGDLKDALIKNEIVQFDLPGWLNDNILDLFKDYHDIAKAVTNNPNIISVKPKSIKRINDINIQWIDDMGSGDKFVSLSVSLDLDCIIYFDNKNLVNNKEKKLYLVNSDSPRLIEFPYPVEISGLLIIVTLILDTGSFSVIAANIGPIDGQFGTIDVDGTFDPN